MTPICRIERSGPEAACVCAVCAGVFTRILLCGDTPRGATIAGPKASWKRATRARGGRRGHDRIAFEIVSVRVRHAQPASPVSGRHVLVDKNPRDIPAA
jgi:hypothetical protein